MSDCLDGWHRIKSEVELELFILAGWTNFTLKPFGSVEYIYINPFFLSKQVACLAARGFHTLSEPHWTIYRDLFTGVAHERVCVPGPLTAHDKAQLMSGREKLISILTKKVEEIPTY